MAEKSAKDVKEVKDVKVTAPKSESKLTEVAHSAPNAKDSTVYLVSGVVQFVDGMATVNDAQAKELKALGIVK